MSNVIRMNFDQMNDIIAAQEKCENNIVETARDFDKSFKKHTNAGALVNSVRVEKQGLATIASAISGMNRVIRNHTENMKNFDEAVARKADEIEIPQDFLNENATKINTYNQSILAKIDGRSVNEGVTATAFNEIDESAIAAEGLLDITKQATQQQKYDETSSVSHNNNMKDITSDKTQQEQKISEDSIIGKSILGDINKGDNQQQQNIDESSVIGKSMLGNISTGTTTQVQNIDTSAFAAAQILEQDEKEKKKKEQEAREKETMNYNFDVPNEIDK